MYSTLTRSEMFQEFCSRVQWPVGFLCNRNILSISQKNFFTWNGSCVMIPCTIGHNNPPLIPSTISLLWYFNPSYKETLKDYEGTLLYHSNNSRDSVITTSPDFQGRVTFVGDLKRNCSVKISQLQKNDSGPYGARLYAQTERPSKTRPSKYEKWYQSTQITIIEPPPAPKLVTNPREIIESQGRTTDVSCSVNYHCPDEPITLTLSGLEETRWFSPSTSSRNGVIETKARFIPTWEDHGKTLRCLLHSHDGSEISQGNVLLDVKHSPKGVMIKATPGRTVREGEKLSLECVVNSSNPEPTTYTWYKDGQPTNNYGKKINIDSVEEQHSGRYRCDVTNGYGIEKAEETTINVQYGPKDTQFRKSTEEITEGRDVVLQCSSRGNPAVTYAWYKRNQSGILVNQSELHLLKIQPSDSGTYYCTAQNDLGNSTSSDAILDVYYAPKNVQLTVDAPDHRPIKERDTIILNCSVGSCNPRVTWYRWLKSSNEIKKGDQPILQIRAAAEQATSYTCDACNRVNCGRSNPVAVNVHFVPKDVNVVQKPTGPIREGNRVELRCEVGMATPPGVTYMWYKKGKRVDCAAAVWPILAVGPADRGTYSCEANNSIGTSERSTIMLDVQYGPHNVSLSLNNQDVITEGMKVVLVCTCAAYPSAYTYRWYRNDEQYTQGTSDILILQRVQVQDSGTYRCIAKNTISTGNSQPLHLIVSYSKATVLKRTIIGLGILFSVLIVLGFVVVVLRRWKKNPGTGSMQRSGSFFVRKPKAERLCNNNNRPNETRAENVFGFLNQSAEVSVSYAAIRVPPSSSEGRTEYARVKPQRIALAPSDESAVYSVITKPGLPAKGDTKHDYENVEKNNEEELHYSSLVNLAPRPHLTFPDSETDSESEESIQYASLKH